MATDLVLMNHWFLMRDKCLHTYGFKYSCIIQIICVSLSISSLYVNAYKCLSFSICSHLNLFCSNLSIYLSIYLSQSAYINKSIYLSILFFLVTYKTTRPNPTLIVGVWTIGCSLFNAHALKENWRYLVFLHMI